MFYRLIWKDMAKPKQYYFAEPYSPFKSYKLMKRKVSPIAMKIVNKTFSEEKSPKMIIQSPQDNFNMQFDFY